MPFLSAFEVFKKKKAIEKRKLKNMNLCSLKFKILHFCFALHNFCSLKFAMFAKSGTEAE